jgi:hypothetical protein
MPDEHHLMMIIGPSLLQFIPEMSILLYNLFVDELVLLLLFINCFPQMLDRIGEWHFIFNELPSFFWECIETPYLFMDG